jgi:DNA-binding CsgD family transcriptional regulator
LIFTSELGHLPEKLSPLSCAMSGERELVALTDLIYEAVLDNDVWPSVLTTLADAVGAAQIAMPTFDWRASIFTTIAPRIDPDLLASYKEYWAFHEPIVPRATSRPAGEIYFLDNLMPREEFAATPVFNEWWQPAGCGLSALGANLVAEERFTALVSLFNAPGKDGLVSEQYRLLEAALPHFIRAVRISRHLFDLELKHIAAAERFEAICKSAMLIDTSARVVVANPAAKAMLDACDGFFLRKGRLAVCGNPDAVERLAVSCARTSLDAGGPGGELKVPRGPNRSPLYVMVAPLRARTRFPDVSWSGFGSPVAIVTITDHDLDQRRQQMSLRRRFGLTSAEAALAAEILKGDGRKAAARRCGIAAETAKTHLSNIFEKTGAHRQAELVRLLLNADGAQGTKP